MQRGFPWFKKEDHVPFKQKAIYLKGNLVVLRDKALEDISNDYRWRCDRNLAILDATHPVRMSYEEFYSLERDELKYENPPSKPFSIQIIDLEPPFLVKILIFGHFGALNESLKVW